VELLAENGDVPTLAATATYLHSCGTWACDAMPDIARCVRLPWRNICLYRCMDPVRYLPNPKIQCSNR